MYAIVETGGKQYKLEEGRYVDIELVDGEENDKVVFDKVVMLVNGAKSKVGAPYVDKASVEGKIVKHDKDKKVIVNLKYKKGRLIGFNLDGESLAKNLNDERFNKIEILITGIDDKSAANKGV